MSNLLIILYMSDIISFGKTKNKINELIHSLSETPKMKEFGMQTKFLGIKMNWLMNLQVSVSQKTLATTFL